MSHQVELPEDRARAAMDALRALSTHRGDTEDVKAFLEAFSQEHRTNQQNIMRLAVALIEELASKGWGQFDGRNEASVKLAKDIVTNLADWERKKYLPYV